MKTPSKYYGLRAGVAFGLLALLAGCVSPEDCDPSQANILSAVACEGSGSARAREEMKTADAQAAEARREGLKTELETMRAEATVRRAERLSLSQRLSDVDQSMIRLGNVMSRARSIETINQSRLNALRSELTRLQDARTASANPSSNEVVALERETEVMFREMDALLGQAG